MSIYPDWLNVCDPGEGVGRVPAGITGITRAASVAALEYVDTVSRTVALANKIEVLPASRSAAKIKEVQKEAPSNMLARVVIAEKTTSRTVARIGAVTVH